MNMTTQTKFPPSKSHFFDIANKELTKAGDPARATQATD